MSAYVLLNLLNELGKRDKKRGLPSLINSIKQEHESRLDSNYHMTLRLLLNIISGVKTL